MHDTNDNNSIGQKGGHCKLNNDPPSNEQRKLFYTNHNQWHKLGNLIDKLILRDDLILEITTDDFPHTATFNNDNKNQLFDFFNIVLNTNKDTAFLIFVRQNSELKMSLSNIQIQRVAAGMFTKQGGLFLDKEETENIIIINSDEEVIDKECNISYHNLDNLFNLLNIKFIFNNIY